MTEQNVKNCKDAAPGETCVDTTPTYSTVKSKYFDEKKYQFYIVGYLLSLVFVLNGLPILLTTFSRRPPSESVINTLNQNTLLLTGGACSAVSFLVGLGRKEQEEINMKVKQTGGTKVISEEPINKIEEG